MINKNVGSVDSAVRITLGAILILLSFTDTVGWWGWLGVIPLATGIFSRCALYSLLGINTCSTQK
ncbi:DUF2892 domain-containing protein [Bibersteinia trehalosi]|uniref:YgaP family membrane protein n=1 Tax=Bibersteinia trehalosi TaxID=47735 RepID=UPI003D2AAB70